MTEPLSSNQRAAFVHNLRSIAIDLRAEGREIDAACADGGADEIERLTCERDEYKKALSTAQSGGLRLCAEYERLRAALRKIRENYTALDEYDVCNIVNDAIAPDETTASPLSIPPGVEPVNIQATGGACPFCGESYFTSSRPHGPNVCNK
jgi:hypothetical protein